jgi:hypothetical protein
MTRNALIWRNAMEKNVKLGITEWSLPVDGPYGCKIAADVGFEGIQLDVGSKDYHVLKSILW